MTTPQDKDCYGLSWEERHPECAGGVDPLHTNPRTGTHVRDRCEMYNECGRTFKMAEAQRRLQGVAQQQVVPVTNLTRPQPIQPYVHPQQQLSRVQPQPYSVPQQVRPYAPPVPPQPQPQMMMHPSQYYPSVFSPVQTLLPHEAAPFLTISEGRVDGVPTWKRIMLESVRAGFKGVLQQGAFIVDHTPYYGPEPDKK